MKNRIWLVCLLIGVLLVAAACGGTPAASPSPAPGDGDTTGEETEPMPEEEFEEEETAPTGEGVTLEIGIQGEELAFDKKTMEATVARGAPVTVRFTNTSSTQEHNWVLLDHHDMDQASVFNDVAVAAGAENSYFPQEEKYANDVLAHAENQQPGGSTTVTFKAPSPGEYLYICTVPGHFVAGDWGTLTITAP
jgi:azurin